MYLQEKDRFKKYTHSLCKYIIVEVISLNYSFILGYFFIRAIQRNKQPPAIAGVSLSSSAAAAAAAAEVFGCHRRRSRRNYSETRAK